MAFLDVVSLAPNSPVVAERLVAGVAAPEPPGPPPVIEWLSPAPGTPITRHQAITVRVTDADLVLVILSARFPSLGLDEVVYRAGSFTPRYATSSVVSAGAAHTFTVRRSGGWPAGFALALDAVDAEGQVGAG